MTFKINVSNKGKTFKAETDDEDLVGLRIGENIQGKSISQELEGYELKITGTSDKAGFAGFVEYSGPNLKKVLLGYGKGMHKKPKGLKKVNKKPKGLRLRKTVRGNEISLDTVQINTLVVKEGNKKFGDLFEKKKEDAEEKKE